MGMDTGWFGSFLEPYFDAIACALPIWRVFKKEGEGLPGRALTGEAGWNETWEEIYRLRKSDPDGHYDCHHSVAAGVRKA